MALFDPWDPVLEAITLRLTEITSGQITRSCHVSCERAGWDLRFRGSRGGLETIVRPLARGSAAALSDYQLAIIYGLNFTDGDDDGALNRRLRLRDGGRWSEQTLREIVLETLAIARFVLGCASPDDLALHGIELADGS